MRLPPTNSILISNFDYAIMGNGLEVLAEPGDLIRYLGKDEVYCDRVNIYNFYNLTRKLYFTTENWPSLRKTPRGRALIDALFN